jgi:CheY-like chemotaxis protein
VTGTGKNGARRDSDGHSELGNIGWAGLRLLLEKYPVVLWTTDRELRVGRTLGSALSGLGLRSGESEGLTIYEFFGNRDHSFPPIAAHVAALRGESRDLEYAWNDRQLELHIEPLRDQQGACVGVVGIGLDVTDRRAAGRDRKLQDAAPAPANQTPLHQLLRLRIAELSEVLTNLSAVGERLGSDGTGDRADLLSQLARAAGRGTDLVHELQEALGEVPARESRSPAVLDGGETILLVDDEPQVRGFVRRALEEHGYRVLETSAVDEALALGASYPGRIHLLLTDVVLPGMSGPQLAARLAPLRPEMRILYMTGYADDAIVHRGVISAGQALLVKPFTSLGLAHEVRKALRN